MRSIIDPHKPLGVQLKENFKQIIFWDWMFSKWWEKLIIVFCIVFTVVTIARWIL